MDLIVFRSFYYSSAIFHYSSLGLNGINFKVIDDEVLETNTGGLGF